MGRSPFNEDTRVKIPVILQLVRLGYEFLPRTDWENQREPKTNILLDIFAEAYIHLNPGKTAEDARRYAENELVTVLNNNDLGRDFYKKLISPNSGEVLVDFENFNNNTFHVATEVDCSNEGEEFRPDVTVFVNGLPLAFYEVKKPNSHEQMKKERDRMTYRNGMDCFRRYMNITQLMLFSGNQEYADDNRWQGSFYCTTSQGKPDFNFFREKPEVAFTPSAWRELNQDSIIKVLSDTKLIDYVHTPEFRSSISPDRPAARHATSLLSRERFWFMLRFGIAYVEILNDGVLHLEKHIMRYPQLFASLRLRKWLDEGKVKGTIWHTQGSGKTALAYHTVKNLTEYYSRKGIVPRFFFVVDRIELANQAESELSARGLKVVRANSRSKFDEILRLNAGRSNKEGGDEIVVVNIQQFEQDGGPIESCYGPDIKRVFFIDEAHRSYKPTGSFLGALLQAKKDSIYIGLTGTPLLAERDKDETREAYLKRAKSTKEIFGGYIDTYYYNQSIKDGYTLRLLHEPVETEYRVMMEAVLREVEVIVGEARDRQTLYSHLNFVTPMTQYIVNDLKGTLCEDKSIGGMIVSDSQEQARAIKKVLDEKYPEIRAALILNNEGTKETRKDLVDKFQNGELDLLVVCDMLLTGFSAKRLKKLYMGRVVRNHKLLQTLARVNRPYRSPYREWKYGHVVDFADIRKAFDAANAAYMEELKNELGDEWSHFDELFHKPEEIHATVKQIKNYLWNYCPENLADFEQILDSADKKELQQLHRILAEARELKASILGGGYDISLDEIQRFIQMDNMVNERLTAFYQQEAWAEGRETEDMLEQALNSVLFAFKRKGKPEELKIADEMFERIKRAKRALGGCFDRKAAEWANLNDELHRIFGEKGFKEMDIATLEAHRAEMDELESRLKTLQHEEQMILMKYDHDAKYARLHRYLMRNYSELNEYQQSLVEALNKVKHQLDNMLENDANLVCNKSFFLGEISSTIWNTLSTYTTPHLSEAQVNDMAQQLFNEYRERKSA